MSHIRPVTPADSAEWLRMRHALWPDADPGELASEIEAFFSAPRRWTALVMARPDGRLMGLIELSIRQYAEGCTSDNVGYIEGWYVDPDVREQGCGRELVLAGEEWARSCGCTEMGSDALITNDISIHAHMALGYQEVERQVVFRKELG
jgi:aminoglycoside 6'-N-acetyltransferase I